MDESLIPYAGFKLSFEHVKPAQGGTRLLNNIRLVDFSHI